MCLNCHSLLHNTAEETNFLTLATQTYEKICAHAENFSINLNEVNLLNLLNHDVEQQQHHTNDFDFKLEAMDFDDEPLVKSEMVETVLTEDVNLKLEGIEDEPGKE